MTMGPEPRIRMDFRSWRRGISGDDYSGTPGLVRAENLVARSLRRAPRKCWVLPWKLGEITREPGERSLDHTVGHSRAASAGVRVLPGVPGGTVRGRANCFRRSSMSSNRPAASYQPSERNGGEW